MTRWDRITLAYIGLVTLMNDLPESTDIVTAWDALNATLYVILGLACAARLFYIAWPRDDD